MSFQFGETPLKRVHRRRVQAITAPTVRNLLDIVVKYYDGQTQTMGKDEFRKKVSEQIPLTRNPFKAARAAYLRKQFMQKYEKLREKRKVIPEALLLDPDTFKAIMEMVPEDDHVYMLENIMLSSPSMKKLAFAFVQKYASMFTEFGEYMKDREQMKSPTLFYLHRFLLRKLKFMILLFIMASIEKRIDVGARKLFNSIQAKRNTFFPGVVVNMHIREDKRLREGLQWQKKDSLDDAKYWSQWWDGIKEKKYHKWWVALSNPPPWSPDDPPPRALVDRGIFVQDSSGQWYQFLDVSWNKMVKWKFPGDVQFRDLRGKTSPRLEMTMAFIKKYVDVKRIRGFQNMFQSPIEFKVRDLMRVKPEDARLYANAWFAVDNKFKNHPFLVTFVDLVKIVKFMPPEYFRWFYATTIFQDAIRTYFLESTFRGLENVKMGAWADRYYITKKNEPKFTQFYQSKKNIGVSLRNFDELKEIVGKKSMVFRKKAISLISLADLPGSLFLNAEIGPAFKTVSYLKGYIHQSKNYSRFLRNGIWTNIIWPMLINKDEYVGVLISKFITSLGGIGSEARREIHKHNDQVDALLAEIENGHFSDIIDDELEKKRLQTLYIIDPAK